MVRHVAWQRKAMAMIIKTVKMQETQDGSPDGCIVCTYEKGKTYNLPADLADVFVKDLKVATLAKVETV